MGREPGPTPPPFQAVLLDGSWSSYFFHKKKTNKQKMLNIEKYKA